MRSQEARGFRPGRTLVSLGPSGTLGQCFSLWFLICNTKRRKEHLQSAYSVPRAFNYVTLFSPLKKKLYLIGIFICVMQLRK